MPKFEVCQLEDRCKKLFSFFKSCKRITKICAKIIEILKTFTQMRRS